MRTALALRALGLGDFVTGLPALQLLRESLPDHRLVLAAPAVFQPLLPLGVPVDELWPTTELAPISGTADLEYAWDLHGNGPASRRLLDDLGADHVFGFGYHGRPGPRWDRDEHEVARWQRLVCETLRLPPRRAEVRLSVPRAAVTTAVPTAVPTAVTIVHPGAAYASRRWPTPRFLRLIDGLLARGHRVVLTAGPGEQPLAVRLAAATGATALTDLDLLGLFGLVAGARLVICGDTGIAHVASLYRTPSVLLFGPVSPQRWGPPEDGPHIVLWHGDGTGDPHGHEPDPALLRIQPEEVLHAVDQLGWRIKQPWGRKEIV